MLKLILVVTLFVSCAWNFKRNNDLKTIDVTNLDIDKATQQKFVVKEVVQTEEIIEAPKVLAPAKKEAKKNETKKEIVKTDENKKEEIEEEITDEDIQKKNKVIEVYYPKDYPNKFIELDKKSEKVWKQFTPKVFTGESQDIEVSYLGITVGKIFLTTKKDVMVGDKQAYHFYAHLKSAPFYRFIYELDDTLESFVEKKTFLPVSYKLLQIETNKKIEDYQLFDRENHRLYFRYKKNKKGVLTDEKMDLYIPKYSQDAFSMLYFARGLPFETGKSYQFPVTTKDKVWYLSVKKVGEETVTTEYGKIPCLKLEAQTEYDGEYAKKGKMEIWLSNDGDRHIVQFSGEVKFGKIKGTTVSYKNVNKK